MFSYYRLKFQYESDAWSLRTLNFEVSKRKAPIRSVTLMIACYGYTGAASFTDIRLSTKHGTAFLKQMFCSKIDLFFVF